jgi:hypothetical protein
MAEYMDMNPPGLRVCRVSNPSLHERKRPPLGGEKCVGTGEKHTRKTRKPATRVYRPALTFTSR